MKHFLGICVVMCCALIGLGSAIRCYSCKDYTGSCSKQRDCSYDDACLTLTERGLQRVGLDPQSGPNMKIRGQLMISQKCAIPNFIYVLDMKRSEAIICFVSEGGMTYRQCLKYSDCEYSRLGQMFPQVSSFTFKCCNSDLCNSAPSSAASSLIGLLASVAVIWWCIY